MFKIQKEDIQNILKSAESKTKAFAELFLENCKTTSITLENNQIENIRSGIDAGCGFRLIKGEHTFYGYINSLAKEDIQKVVNTVINSANISASSRIIRLSVKNPVYQPEYKIFPSAKSYQEKVNYLVKANQAARNFSKKIKQATIHYGDTEQDVLIANNLGTFAKDQRLRTRFVVNVVAQDKNLIETGFEGPGLASGLEFFEKYNIQEIAQTAAQRAVLLLSAEPAPAGSMPVVLAGVAGGTMVHEACGHALEADFIYKKTSLFHNLINKNVVNPNITIIDDGTIPGNYGSFRFDDEGTPAQKNVLIEKGKLVGLMSDLDNANKLKITPSGNGRRESYRHLPQPRMTNTYIAPGKYSYAEILQSVKKGLLVLKMGGGQVDITNGNFVFEVSEGYLIENGQKGKPVRGATLVGNGIEVLKSVDLVGNDLNFIPGICGKGQAAPVSDGQPTIRIPQITIGGQAT